MEAERQAISDEIVTTLGREVPAYTRPLEGAFGDAVRGGVDQALGQFVAMVRDPHGSQAEREAGRRIYVALGRGELEVGRSIGALLAAYRLGAQVAWRRLADASLEAGLNQQETNLLAESIFAYIDELSAESAEGYAQAQAERAGALDTRRAELIDLIVRGGLGSDPRALAAAVAEAQWRVPDELAVLVWPEELSRTPAGRLPQDSIFTSRDGIFVALIPELRDPGRREQLLGGFAKVRSGVGSIGRPADAPRSFEHARAALKLGAESGAPGLVVADEHRSELIARSDPLLVQEILQSRLAPLEDETANARARLVETLLAWLKNDGNVPSAADELHVHAQTVRYRLAHLRELLGDALDDPEVRFELEYALRAPAA
jgi:hypothetical protein